MSTEECRFPCDPSDHLVRLLGAMRDMPESVRELEIRLGRTSGGRFVPGVDRDTFYRLERDFLDSPLLPSDRWTEVVDFMYVGKCGGRVRTRVLYDAASFEVVKEHVRKTTRGTVTLCRSDDADEGARVAVASEEAVEDLLPSCMPTHVRIKQRRTFVDVRQGRRTWCYELSRTWSGVTRSAAEVRQRTAEPEYEVECELVDEGQAYTHSVSDASLASSLLMKVNILLGDDPSSPLCVQGQTPANARQSPQRG